MDNSLLEAATLGDYASQAALRDMFVRQASLATAGDMTIAAPTCDLMLVAEQWARMAAVHPQATSADTFSLGSILLLRADSCRYHAALQSYGDVLWDEGRRIINGLLASDPSATSSVAWVLQTLANGGDEWAATALDELVASLPPAEAAQVAAEVSEVDRLRAAKEEA